MKKQFYLGLRQGEPVRRASRPRSQANVALGSSLAELTSNNLQ